MKIEKLNNKMQEKFDANNKHPIDIYDFLLEEDFCIPEVVQLIFGILDLNYYLRSKYSNYEKLINEKLDIEKKIKKKLSNILDEEKFSNHSETIVGCTLGLCGHYLELKLNLNPTFQKIKESINFLNEKFEERKKNINNAIILAGGYAEISFDETISFRNNELHRYVIIFSKMQKILGRKGYGVLFYNLMDIYCNQLMKIAGLSKATVIDFFGEILSELNFISDGTEKQKEKEYANFTQNLLKGLQRYKTGYQNILKYNSILEKIENSTA